jgi:hypothetical protein
VQIAARQEIEHDISKLFPDLKSFRKIFVVSRDNSSDSLKASEATSMAGRFNRKLPHDITSIIGICAIDKSYPSIDKYPSFRNAFVLMFRFEDTSSDLISVKVCETNRDELLDSRKPRTIAATFFSNISPQD